MKKKMKCHTFLIILTLIITFCGCGKTNQNMEKEENHVMDSCDWKEKGFSVNENVIINESFFLGKYEKWDHPLDNCSGLYYVDSGVNGNFFWYLAVYEDSLGDLMTGSEATYLLETYQVDQSKIDKTIFMPRDLGVDGDLGYLVGMDYIADGKYMLRWAKNEKNAENLYHQCEDDMIITDFNGNNNVIDFFSQFEEDQLEEYEERELPMLPYVKCHACGNDKIWVLSSSVFGRQKICIYGQNKEKVFEKKAEGNEYYMQPFLNQDNELVLPIRNTENNEIRMSWYDSETKNLKELGRVNDEKCDVKRFVGMRQNKIFYEAADPETGTRLGIVQWNVSTGDRIWILGLDVGNYLQYNTWWIFSDDKIVSGLLSHNEFMKTNDWVVSITDKEESEEGNIRIADLTGSADKLKKCASIASMNHPGTMYRYEDDSSEEKKSVVNAELSQNKGPDIMFVSMKDFYDLEEKGLLLDLSDLVSPETADNLLPGVLEIGKTSQGMMGIPIGLHVETLLIGKGVGKVSEWNLEVAVDFMKRGLLNTSVWSPYVMNSYSDPTLTVQVLTKYSMNHSFLIDWENRKCYFDDKRFVQLLELTKKDGSKNTRSEIEKNDLTWVYLNSYKDLVDFMANYVNEGEIVGFPEEQTNGGFLVADQGVLVVNKNVKDKDAVRFFIEKAFSEDIQNQQGAIPQISALKFNPNNYITTDHNGTRYYFNSFSVDKIDDMDPVDNPILQATRFLNECKPAPRAYTDIRFIITEELRDLYAGTKDAKSVAEVINNRVQLYLSE